MTVAQSLTTYFLAAAVLTMTPGVDTALVLRAATGAGLGVAVVFYVTFLPQFIPAGVKVGPWSFMLAAIHAGQVVLWFALIIAASVPLGRALRRPKLITALDRITGGVFLLFGAKLALSRR